MSLETRRYGATCRVDLLTARDPVGREFVARGLRGEVIGEGVLRGDTIRPESVWITEGATIAVEHVVEFHAEWIPEPTTGVELRHGPNDGGIVHLDRGSDGYPIETLAIARTVVAYGPEEDRPPITSARVLYRRAGIDPVLDRWVYTFEANR